MSTATLTIVREVYNEETGDLVDEIEVTVDVSYTNGSAQTMHDPGEPAEVSIDGAYLYDKKVRTPIELTDEEADSIPEKLEDYFAEAKAEAESWAYDVWKEARYMND